MRKSKETTLIRALNNIITYLTEEQTDGTATNTYLTECTTDVAAIVLLLNEVKTEHNVNVTWVTEALADIAAIVTLANELRTNHATIVTMVNELKADLNLLRTQTQNMCLVTGDTIEGTNANTIQIQTEIEYLIDNQIYTKAVTDNIAMTAAALQADSTYCMYLCSIDTSGSVTITKGTELGTDTAVLPACPASECSFAAFKIATSGATFTSGTTDLGAGGITDTFYDLAFANTGASFPTVIAAADVGAISAGATTSVVATLPATATSPNATGIAATVPTATGATVPTAVPE